MNDTPLYSELQPPCDKVADTVIYTGRVYYLLSFLTDIIMENYLTQVFG